MNGPISHTLKLKRLDLSSLTLVQLLDLLDAAHAADEALIGDTRAGAWSSTMIAQIKAAIPGALEAGLPALIEGALTCWRAEDAAHPPAQGIRRNLSVLKGVLSDAG